MSFESWRVIPAIAEDELLPILSTLDDTRFLDEVVTGIGVTEQDSLFSWLWAGSQQFEGGRLVAVNALRQDAIQIRAGTELIEQAKPVWLQAADFVIIASVQRVQSCYGSWQDGVTLNIFGQ